MGKWGIPEKNFVTYGPMAKWPYLAIFGHLWPSGHQGKEGQSEPSKVHSNQVCAERGKKVRKSTAGLKIWQKCVDYYREVESTASFAPLRPTGFCQFLQWRPILAGRGGTSIPDLKSPWFQRYWQWFSSLSSLLPVHACVWGSLVSRIRWPSPGVENCSQGAKEAQRGCHWFRCQALALSTLFNGGRLGHIGWHQLSICGASSSSW